MCAYGLDRALVIEVDEAVDIPRLCEQLETLAAVAWACPDYIGQGGREQVDDTYYGEQWHHRNVRQANGIFDADIDTDLAWPLVKGSATVIVAVLDSGIDTDHPEFQGRLLQGYDFVNEDDDPEDDHGHGTRVTGVLAARGQNHFGVAGVDWYCSILPVKVLDATNLGTTTNLIRGLAWAVDHGAHVINMSLVDYTESEVLDLALHAARDSGAILVSCAGNQGPGDADVSWPGASEAVISVGYTTPFDRRSAYSGTGAALDVVAPGVDIATVLVGSDADGYEVFRGCSAATPLVSGIASLIKFLRPSIHHEGVFEILITTSEDQVGSPLDDKPGRDDSYGYGRVNAALAVMRAAPGLAPFDVGTPGTEGVVPMLSVHSRPTLGNRDFRIAIDEGLGGAAALLFIGLGPIAEPLRGSAFLVQDPVAVLPLTLDGTPGTPANGSATVGPFPLPADVSLAGLTVVLQSAVFDPAAEPGFCLSNALQLTLGS
ncbi:MAG: S8 family serine peptidase [Planctomycetota bacterium]